MTEMHTHSHVTYTHTQTVYSRRKHVKNEMICRYWIPDAASIQARHYRWLPYVIDHVLFYFSLARTVAGAARLSVRDDLYLLLCATVTTRIPYNLFFSIFFLLLTAATTLS